MLFFAPGRLTLEFLAGKRARYVPPLRLYLVMSVLLFLVTSLDPTDNDEDEFNAEDGSAIDTAIREACARGAADDFQSITKAFTDNIPLLVFMVIVVLIVMRMLGRTVPGLGTAMSVTGALLL